MEATTRLSNLQLELLRLYQNTVTEQDLNNFKQYLAYYFAEKASNEFDEFIQQNNISVEEVNNWSTEHFRSKSFNLS